MPETPFIAELPDGTRYSCYSPSSVVKNYFARGQTLPASTFLMLSRTALNEASDRVREKFGFACSAASSSLAEIERWAGELPPDTPITITHI